MTWPGGTLIFFATFSFQTRRRLRHSIPSNMDLTPTNSDDEVKELAARLCNLCRHQANLQKQKGQNCKVYPFGNNDFGFVFEIVVGKSQLSLHFAFCIFSFLTKCFLYRMPILI